MVSCVARNLFTKGNEENESGGPPGKKINTGNGHGCGRGAGTDGDDEDSSGFSDREGRCYGW